MARPSGSPRPSCRGDSVHKASGGSTPRTDARRRRRARYGRPRKSGTRSRRMHASGARTHRWSQTSPSRGRVSASMLVPPVPSRDRTAGRCSRRVRERPRERSPTRTSAGRPLRSAYSADSSSSDGRPRRTRYRHGTSERRPSGTACPSPSGGPSGGCSWLASVRIRDDPAGVPRPDYEVTFLFPVFRERLGNLSEHTHGRVERDAACQLACLGSM